MAHRPSIKRCSQHPTERLTHYCEDCRDLVCESCLLIPPHRQHRVSLAEKVLPKHIQSLEQYIVQANAHVQGTENLMDNLAQTNMKIQENRSAAELRIRTYFNRMRNLLNERERHFVSTVRLDTSKKMETVADRRGKIKIIMDALITSLKTMDSFTRQPDDITILRSEGAVLEQTDHHIQDLLQWYNAPSFDTTITLPCVEDRNFEEVCRLVGDPSYRVCPPNCTSQKKSPSKSMSPPLIGAMPTNGAPPPRPPKPKNSDTFGGFLSPDLLAYTTKARSESILSTDSMCSDNSSDMVEDQDHLSNGLATPPPPRTNMTTPPLPPNEFNTPPLPPKSPKLIPKLPSDNQQQSFFNHEPPGSPGSPKRPIPKPRGISLSTPQAPTILTEPPSPCSDDVMTPGIVVIGAKQMLSSAIRGESVHPVGVGTGMWAWLGVWDSPRKKIIFQVPISLYAFDYKLIL